MKSKTWSVNHTVSGVHFVEFDEPTDEDELLSHLDTSGWLDQVAAERGCSTDEIKLVCDPQD